MYNNHYVKNEKRGRKRKEKKREREKKRTTALCLTDFYW